MQINGHNRWKLLKKYIDLSEKMGAKNIRIFGDPVPKTPTEIDQTLDWEADGIRACDGLAGDAGVALCLETHGNLLASYLAEVLYRSEAQNTYVNWHAAHHVRHGQPVDVAYVHLRNKVRHAHVSFGNEGTYARYRERLTNTPGTRWIYRIYLNRGYQSKGFGSCAKEACRTVQNVVIQD